MKRSLACALMVSLLAVTAAAQNKKPKPKPKPKPGPTPAQCRIEWANFNNLVASERQQANDRGEYYIFPESIARRMHPIIEQIHATRARTSTL